MYTLYALCHLVPHWSSLLPVSLALGAATACLWAVKFVYVSINGACAFVSMKYDFEQNLFQEHSVS
jgi:hypothetical protein